MKREKLYRLVMAVFRPLERILFRQRVYGRENVPDGPAILCAPHSNAADPVLISLALGGDRYLHHLAKIEAASIPLAGWLMKKMGSIFVRRGASDINSYKECLRVLRAGEKLLLLPEGTRVHGDQVVGPKTGVIHMANKTGVPILPIYLPRDKKPFHSHDVIIGKPYYVNVTARQDYERLSKELMDRIWELRDMK